jgi:hypothetical protein
MLNEQRYRPAKPVPLFIRIPSTGIRCPYSGLSQSSLDKLVRPQAANGFKPPVRSKLFRQSGTISKVRLIDYQSLLEYLNSLPEGDQLQREEEVA